VYTSPAENSASLNEKGEVDLKQPWSDIDPYPLAGTLFIVVIRTHASNLE